jgi:hypothetical protein
LTLVSGKLRSASKVAIVHVSFFLLVTGHGFAAYRGNGIKALYRYAGQSLAGDRNSSIAALDATVLNAKLE